jgi:GT2 family glycosyltransferase
MSNNRILAIVLAYNDDKSLRKCLRSLVLSDYPCEILVINNGLSLSSNFQGEFDFELIENTRNLGFGKSCNQGFLYAINNGFDYVLLINQDAYVEASTIGSLIDSYIPHSDLFILSPLDYSSSNRISDYMLQNLTTETINQLIHRTEINPPLIPQKMIAAACWFIATEKIKLVGGFNPLFAHYGEDNELFERSVTLGYWNSILTTAKFFHRGIKNNKLNDDYSIYCTKLCLEYSLRLKGILDLNVDRIYKLRFFLKMVKRVFVNYHSWSGIRIEIYWAFFFLQRLNRIRNNGKIKSQQFLFSPKEGIMIDELINYKLFRSLFKG